MVGVRQCSIPSRMCGPKPFFGPFLGQIGKSRFLQQIRADEECPWILEQGQHYNILTPGQRRTVVCAGDSVVKFTEAGGHGQEAVISEALGPWAAKVRLLTLEFMGVEGPLLLFALCWLAPRYIAAGVSNMGVKAVYGLPLPVFFDLETWHPNYSASWRHSDAGLWKLMSRYKPRMQPGLQALIPLPKFSGGLPAAPWPDEYTGESFTQAQGVVKFETNMWRVVPP